MIREINGTGFRVTSIGLDAMPASMQGRPEERSALASGGPLTDTAHAHCLSTSGIAALGRLPGAG